MFNSTALLRILESKITKTTQQGKAMGVTLIHYNEVQVCHSEYFKFFFDVQVFSLFSENSFLSSSFVFSLKLSQP